MDKNKLKINLSKKIDISNLRIFESPSYYRIFEKILLNIDYKNEKLLSLSDLIHYKLHKKKKFSPKENWSLITKLIFSQYFLNKDYNPTSKEDSFYEINLFAYKYILYFCKTIMIKINFKSIKNKISIIELRNNYLSNCLQKCEIKAQRRLKTRRKIRYQELIQKIIAQSKKDNSLNNRTSISVTNNFKVLIGSRRSIIHKKLNVNIIDQINYYKNKQNEHLSDDQKEIIYIAENKLPKGHFTEKFIGPTDEEGVYKKHFDITNKHLKKNVFNKHFRNQKRKFLLSPLHDNNSNSSLYKSSFPSLNNCFSLGNVYNKNTSVYQNYLKLNKNKKNYNFNSFNNSNNSKSKSKSKSKINIKISDNYHNMKLDGKKMLLGYQSKKKLNFKKFFFSKSDMFY